MKYIGYKNEMGIFDQLIIFIFVGSWFKFIHWLHTNKYMSIFILDHCHFMYILYNN